MKEQASWPTSRARISELTDLSGPFDTLVQEFEAESLAEWEQTRVKLFQHPSFRASFERTQPLIVSGRNELWTIEAEG